MVRELSSNAIAVYKRMIILCTPAYALSRILTERSCDARGIKLCAQWVQTFATKSSVKVTSDETGPCLVRPVAS